ncbi:MULTISPECIES: hypothetical protein [Vibrionaceae]|uniref:Uncharacterized protein n=1 Tax=Grimontia kaedaensis TaxID=2872157 RepID=A0ABY4WNE4_9GAMM|nr:MULTISPECIES: hypothetical protein [Vibrionaceae]PML82179.1 hypothetical protein BCT69_02225 [Enterovibrio norvegicus]PMN66217.1 hypothetical protein BCT27_24605 [Enterovibrio norvegicus]USH01088.1 hypothetical protein K6Q96_09050 [Grimontia kaedaensis]
MKSYEEIRGHKQDFEVSYRLYPPSEGGLQSPSQHMRCDFAYAEDNVEKSGIYMIHPEFLDQNGMPIPEGVPIPSRGLASMWVLVPEMREKVHIQKLQVGTKGYFMSGSRRLGEVQVTRLVDLLKNV